MLALVAFAMLLKRTDRPLRLVLAGTFDVAYLINLSPDLALQMQEAATLECKTTSTHSPNLSNTHPLKTSHTTSHHPTPPFSLTSHH